MFVEELGIILLLTSMVVCFSPDTYVEGDITLAHSVKCVTYMEDSDLCKVSELSTLLDQNDE